MASIIGSVSGVSNNTAAGSSGLGYRGSQANILNPATQGQADATYTQSQDAVQRQQDFLRAVQSQNGLQNQTSVFNQQQAVANGTGPNPALAMLNEQTGKNVAAQTAIQAGQRGASQNAGMIARNAAKTGADIQQQSAGQAATLQANQSLNALNGMGQLATNQANQEANATGAYTGATQGEQGQILGSIQGQNNANVGMTSNINTGQSSLAGIAAQGQQGLLGQVAGGIGSAFHLAEGGKIPSSDKEPVKLAYGTTDIQAPAGGGPSSSVGKFFHGLGSSAPQPLPSGPGAAPNPAGAPKDMASGIAQGKAAYEGAKGAYNKIHDFFSPPPTDPNGMSNIGSNIQNMNYNVNQGPLGIGTPGSALPQGPGASSLQMPELGAKGADSARGLLDSTSAADASAAGEAAEAGEGAEAASAAGEGSEVLNAVGDVAELLAARGGKVPALVSPGEQYLAPKDVKKVAKGANPLAVGERIPGKPKHPGNDYRNDTVKRSLDEGGVVIPNEIMEQPKNVRDKKAEAFVRQYLAKGGKVQGMVTFHSKRKK